MHADGLKLSIGLLNLFVARKHHRNHDQTGGQCQRQDHRVLDAEVLDELADDRRADEEGGIAISIPLVRNDKKTAPAASLVDIGLGKVVVMRTGFPRRHSGRLRGLRRRRPRR